MVTHQLSMQQEPYLPERLVEFTGNFTEEEKGYFIQVMREYQSYFLDHFSSWGVNNGWSILKHEGTPNQFVARRWTWTWEMGSLGASSALELAEKVRDSTWGTGKTADKNRPLWTTPLFPEAHIPTTMEA